MTDFGSTKIVAQTVTPIAQRVNKNKKTDKNIQRLKMFFSKNEQLS
jgi:hypothetical protein